MRARLLKPGFFTNEDLAQLPVRARLLFAGLWGLADRDGRLEDRPPRIKAAIFPYDRVNVEPLLQALARAGFVARYTAASTRCLVLPTFQQHQHPHRREPPSTLPPPPRQPARPAGRSAPGPRPIYMPRFKAYCAIFRRVLDRAPNADLGELAAQFKDACAAEQMHCDGETTRKVIDAVIHARRRRA